MVGLRIPPIDQEYHFFDRNEKIMINPLYIELICLSI